MGQLEKTLWINCLKFLRKGNKNCMTNKQIKKLHVFQLL